MTAQKTFEWTLRLFGLACVVMASERLVALRRRSFWARLNSGLAVAREQFSRPEGYRRAKYTAQGVKILGGSGCLFLPRTHPVWLAVILVVTAAALIYDRRLEHVGGDGADQQLRVIGVALAVTALGVCVDSAALRTGLFFLAFQLLCCYGVAGVAKLRTAAWRSGEAIRCIVASDAFGNGPARRFLALHTGVALVLSWAAMLFEAFFPLAILNASLAITGLTLALCFHVAIAAGMRLNSFLWVFPVSYPAFYYAACEISRFLFAGWTH